MSSNVGLSTPRGSGTSGYVQRNLSVLKPRAAGAGAPYAPLDGGRGPPRPRKPDEEILKHDRMREIEIKVLELQDRLEDEGKLDDEAIEEECEAYRTKLLDEAERERKSRSGWQGNARRNGAGVGEAKMGRDGIKKYQVHELAEAKIKESDRLRRALGLKNDEIGEDDNGQNQAEHPMARQERRKRERELESTKLDLDREDRIQGKDYD